MTRRLDRPHSQYSHTISSRRKSHTPIALPLHDVYDSKWNCRSAAETPGAVDDHRIRNGDLAGLEEDLLRVRREVVIVVRECDDCARVIDVVQVSLGVIRVYTSTMSEGHS